MRLTLLFLFFTIFSCSKSGDKSKVIEISLQGEISSLDPAACFDTICMVPVAQVYESLYEFDYLKRPYQIRPLLAEGFPVVSSDRLKYVFKIKKGIKYHDSELLPKDRTVKAQDFIDQIKRLAFLGTNSRGWWLFDGKVKGLNEWRTKVQTDLNKFFQEPVPGLIAKDEYTLIIELKRPFPQLLYGLTMSFTAPVPAEAIKSSNNDFTLKTVGTGAYFITNYNPNQIVELSKNQNYISSTYPTEGNRLARESGLLKDAGAMLPFENDVRLIVMKESQTEWLNFLKRKIDLVNLTKDQYHVALTPIGKLKPEILKDNIRLQSSPTLIYWWMAFNLKDPILKNINLRKAIAHGVNIDKYIELFTFNVAQKANSIYPPGIPGYDPSSELPYKYDVKLAQDFLKKAGFPEGKGLAPIKFDIRGTDTSRRLMGEFIQKELKLIGINVEVVINTFPSFLEKARKGQLQFWQGGWVLDYPDAENVLQLLSSSNLPPGQNYFNFTNVEFDQLFKEASEIEDGARKNSLMKRMEFLVNSELPWVMQYYTRNYILSHNYLQNFMYSDIIYNHIKYLKLKDKQVR